MGLVDDGVLPGDVGAHLARPQLKVSSTTTALRHPARVVAAVEGKVLARAPRAIAEMRIAPDQAAGEPFGIGIEQQLVGVEAVSAFRRIGAMDAIAIELPRRDVVEIAVPDVLVALGQVRCRSSSRRPWTSNRQSSTFSALAENSAKLVPLSVPGCSKAGRASRGQAHTSAFRYEKDRGQRRDGQAEFGDTAFERMHAAAIADIAAAIRAASELSASFHRPANGTRTR